METSSRRTRIADEIRAELARQRKSQAWLSTATGIKKSTLHSRLQGAFPFEVDEIDLVAHVLNVPFMEFMRRSEPTND